MSPPPATRRAAPAPTRREPDTPPGEHEITGRATRNRTRLRSHGGPRSTEIPCAFNRRTQATPGRSEPRNRVTHRRGATPPQRADDEIERDGATHPQRDRRPSSPRNPASSNANEIGNAPEDRGQPVNQRDRSATAIDDSRPTYAPFTAPSARRQGAPEAVNRSPSRRAPERATRPGHARNRNESERVERAMTPGDGPGNGQRGSGRKRTPHRPRPKTRPGLASTTRR